MTPRLRSPIVAFLPCFALVACAAALSPVFAAALSLAGEAEADSRITSVTVYANRAMVERTAKLLLQPGRHRVSFAGLPSTVDERSFRVGGRAAFTFTILGSETRRIFHKEAVDARIRSLQVRIDELEARKREVEARLGIVQSQQAFVESVRSSSTDLLSKELALGKMDTGSWKGAYDFLGSSLEDLAERRLVHEAKLKELDAELTVLAEELQVIGRSGPDESLNAVAEVDVGSPGGEVELTLTYLVTGASWSPSYDARLLFDEGKIEMTSYGVVTQKTGEDWSDVKLALSTAHPATGAAPPSLEAWYLEPYRPVPVAYEMESSQEQLRGGKGAPDRVAGDEKEEAIRALPVDSIVQAVGLQAGMVAVASRVDRAGVTATYDIAAREDVPADGTPIKTVIGTMSFKSKLQHTTTPVMVEMVYLSSEMENDSEYALLPGQVDVFVGPDMVGTQGLGATTVPGETFNLSFGTDPEIKVKRETIKKEKSKPGRRMTLFQAFKTTLVNRKSSPVEVLVKDRVPVSRSEEIKIDIERMEPEPDSMSPDGITGWRIRLAPGEEAHILMEYEITYPGDVAIRGL